MLAVALTLAPFSRSLSIAVQNTFFIGTSVQLVTSIAAGAIAGHVSLALAFSVIGIMYGGAAITAAWPVVESVEVFDEHQVVCGGIEPPE